MKAAPLLAAISLTTLLALPANGQDPQDREWPEVAEPTPDAPPPEPAPRIAAPAPAPSTFAPWTLRTRAQLGGGVFDYTERLSSLDAESDFTSGTFAIRSSVEGNLNGFSPHFRLMSQFTGGGEEFESGTTQQENDLFIATVLIDVGVGFRIPLSEQVTLVPSLAYTFDYLGFERDEFKINGTRVSFLDLDGDRIDSVGETIIGHGVTTGLSMECLLTPTLDLHVHMLATVFPEATVDNEIGGEIGTEGYLLRGGFALNVRLTDRLALSTSLDTGWHEYKKSTQKTRSGSATTVVVQFPDSTSIWVVLGVGVEFRF